MLDSGLFRVSPCIATSVCRVAAKPTATSCLAPLLLAVALSATSAAALNGDCGQPLTSGANPSSSDCLFILKTAVGSASCEVECICAPKGTLPTSASDALLCLKHAVGQDVSLNCPCAEPTTTTTTINSGLVGAIAFQGRMNANQQIGLPAASAACEEEFPGSHFCEYSELVASQGAKLTGLEDVDGATVTSFWAIDAEGSEARQCGQSLASGAPLWTYNTGHVGVGGDSVTLNNGAGTLGSLVVGGGANRNCGSSKWVGCCR